MIKYREKGVSVAGEKVQGDQLLVWFVYGKGM